MSRAQAEAEAQQLVARLDEECWQPVVYDDLGVLRGKAVYAGGSCSVSVWAYGDLFVADFDHGWSYELVQARGATPRVAVEKLKIQIRKFLTAVEAILTRGNQ